MTWEAWTASETWGTLAVVPIPQVVQMLLQVEILAILVVSHLSSSNSSIHSNNILRNMEVAAVISTTSIEEWPLLARLLVVIQVGLVAMVATLVRTLCHQVPGCPRTPTILRIWEAMGVTHSSNHSLNPTCTADLR